MTTLTNVEIGSVVGTLVENIPAGISGLLPTLVDQQVYTAELITGDSIPVNAIKKQYQPGVISLTIGNVLGLMDAQGIGTKNVKMGELSIEKGLNTSSSKEWKELGYKQIKEIGERISFYQVWSSNA